MGDTYRVLVTGSRDWVADGVLSYHLGRAVGEGLRTGRPVVVVHGACLRGADALADRLARDHGITTEPHPADWDNYGKAAGFRRNAEMVALGADVCLVFKRKGAANKGTSHCAELARKAGIPVREFWGE